ncbi:MAG: alpha/beta hydrolase [Gammaproteobacteria bacterium HGW-Gammaproteobacteria-14]|nr:MAG: alpha/beta hydrolase [Gammaproteobacteria bacterium HGW-Gammaproteobacteria-14]
MTTSSSNTRTSNNKRNNIAAPQGASQRIIATIMRGTLRTLLKPMFSPAMPTPALRLGLRALASTMFTASGIRFQPIQLGSVAGEAAASHEPSDKVVLYLHGGAYCVGSPATHRSICSYLAKASNATVFAIDYRLAPEHPYPAANDDALIAYRWLLDNGYAAGQITIAGDSAGGGLTLSTAMRLRDEDLPLPGSLIVLSPWADLTHPTKHLPEPTGEVMLSWPTLENAVKQYAPNHRDDPRVSPLLGDLSQLPPTLIITGSDEILLNDSERLYSALSAADVEVRFNVYQDRWHVFPAQAGILKSANDAIEEMAGWVNRTET